MARPKGSTNKAKEAQGVEVAKEAEVTTVEETKTVEVKVKPIEKKVDTRRGGHVAIVDGAEVYWSKTLLDIAFRRNSHTIEIPKGSDYIPPVDAKCENCG
jgi:hypothetical protein